jgi:hypothetical protein
MTDPTLTPEAEAIREILRESEARVHEFFRVIEEPVSEPQADSSRKRSRVPDFSRR